GPRVEWTSGAQGRIAGFEAEQAVARKSPPQLADRPQRGVGPAFAVVNENEREQRVRLRVARIGRRLFDLAQRAFAIAAEAGEMRQQAQRRRQRRDRVAVQTDDQSGILAARLDLERALVLVIRAAG